MVSLEPCPFSFADPITVAGVMWGADFHVFSVCFDVSIPETDYLS